LRAGPSENGIRPKIAAVEVNGMSIAKGMRLAVMVIAVGRCLGAATAQNIRGCAYPGVGPMIRNCVAPYSYTEVTTHTQTLSDGTLIESRSETRRAMDAEGRDRTEMMMGLNTVTANDQVSIDDPVAHLRIQLMPNRKIAQIWHTDGHPAPQNENDKSRTDMLHAFNKAMQLSPEEWKASAQAQLKPKCSNEELEPETFEGMKVTVRRTTCVYPVGFQGNDREIHSLMEFWVLSESGITVHSVEDDPRMGHTEMRVIDFKREPPDPALFRVPEDYQVFDFSNMQ
jgi:hypothetical protein